MASHLQPVTEPLSYSEIPLALLSEMVAFALETFYPVTGEGGLGVSQDSFRVQLVSLFMITNTNINTFIITYV